MRRREDSTTDGDVLDAALTAFVGADGWQTWKTSVEEHPVLLTDAAEAAMALLIHAASANDDEHTVGVFETQLMLLRRCREVGIEAAFAELSGEAGIPAALSSVWAAAEKAQEAAAEREPAALQAAVEAFTAVVRHPAFGDAEPSAQARVWYGLGVFEAELYQAGASPQALERAIDAFRRAVAAEPVDGPDRADYRAALGTALGLRYERSRSSDDLDEGIAELEAALGVSLGVDRRPALLHDLAATLARRYEHGGELDDLERSIAASQEALPHADPAELPLLLTGVVNGLMARYERTGDIADLQAATNRAREALAAGTGTRHESVLLATLGAAELELHDRCQTEGGLERAIDALDQAFRRLARSSPTFPGAAYSLGAARFALYERDGVAGALGAAETAHAAALAALPADAPERARVQAALGLVQLHRAMGEGGDAGTLAPITELLDAAVAQMPEGAPDRSIAIANSAFAHRAAYDATQAAGELEAAVTAYREAAASGLTAQLDVALAAARDWGDWASERAAWDEAAEAYDSALRAADRLFELQVGRPEKEVWLGAASGLAARAASALIRQGDPERAAETLERGRVRLLGEALARDHADLAALCERRPDLAERFERAADRVRANDHRELALPDPSLRAETRAERLRAARADLEEVIEGIRLLDGFADFLHAPDFDELARLGSRHPLVYVSAGADEGHALVVGLSGGAFPVTLPALTDEALRERTADFLVRTEGSAAPAAVDDITAWLWTAVMSRIVAAVDGVDRVTLIPVGLLTVLPLHAAWRADRRGPTGRRYALEDLLITYAPSGRVLHQCRQRAASASAEVLVAVDDPVGLRHAASEVDAIARHFGSVRRFSGATATVGTVVQALVEADVAHFACHGTARVDDPLSSGLELARAERLDLRTVLTAPAVRARLAVLSACETARAGTDLPDEVVGLPAGFIQAGAAGVVGSLWRVPDRATMDLVTRFYARWSDDGLEPAEALRRAQIELRDAAAGRAGAEPVVASRHIGDPERSREPEAGGPFAWAAFSYVGA